MAEKINWIELKPEDCQVIGCIYDADGDIGGVEIRSTKFPDNLVKLFRYSKAGRLYRIDNTGAYVIDGVLSHTTGKLIILKQPKP